MYCLFRPGSAVTKHQRFGPRMGLEVPDRFCCPVNSQQWLMGPRVPWNLDPRMTGLARASNNCKLRTRLLVIDGTPHEQTHNCMKINSKKRNICSGSQMGAWHHERPAGWPSVVTLLWIWFSGSGAWNCLPSTIKNEWSYTSTPPYIFMAECFITHIDNRTRFLRQFVTPVCVCVCIYIYIYIYIHTSI
jgi:hypothetical protein